MSHVRCLHLVPAEESSQQSRAMAGAVGLFLVAIIVALGRGAEAFCIVAIALSVYPMLVHWRVLPIARRATMVDVSYRKGILQIGEVAIPFDEIRGVRQLSSAESATHYIVLTVGDEPSQVLLFKDRHEAVEILAHIAGQRESWRFELPVALASGSMHFGRVAFAGLTITFVVIAGVASTQGWHLGYAWIAAAAVFGVLAVIASIALLVTYFGLVWESAKNVHLTIGPDELHVAGRTLRLDELESGLTEGGALRIRGATGPDVVLAGIETIPGMKGTDLLALVNDLLSSPPNKASS